MCGSGWRSGTNGARTMPGHIWGRAGEYSLKTWIFVGKEANIPQKTIWCGQINIPQKLSLKVFFTRKRHEAGTMARDIFEGCFCFPYNTKYTNSNSTDPTELTRMFEGS